MKLINAIKEGNNATIKQCLTDTAHLFESDDSGNNVFHTLALSINKWKAPDYRLFIEALKNPGAKLKSLMQIKNSNGLTPLDILQRIPPYSEFTKREIWLITLLIQHGADPNNKLSGIHHSLLHRAAANGNVPMVKLLLSHKAAPHSINSSGLTPIDYTLPLFHMKIDSFSKVYVLSDDYQYKRRSYKKIEAMLKERGATLIENNEDLSWPNAKLAAERLKQRQQKHRDQIPTLDNTTKKSLQTIGNKLKQIHLSKKITEIECDNIEKAREIQEQHVKTHYVFINEYSDHILCTLFEKFTTKEQAEIDKLNKQSRSFVAKHQLGWEMLQRSSQQKNVHRYLAQHPTIALELGTYKIPVTDLRNADDYKWIVNTVLTRPERLEELPNPRFFSCTPFISCSLIDKNTRAFSGGHHANLLFPMYLALEVPPKAIQYMGPTDIGSPYCCPPKAKLEYLQQVIPHRMLMDTVQATLQSNSLAPPSLMWPALKRTGLFKPQGYKRSGQVPLYTQEHLSKATQTPTENANSYNELIVSGNVLNSNAKPIQSAGVILIEEYWLKQYRELREGQLLPHYQKKVEKSLELLQNLCKKTDGKLKIALIKTNPKGYQHKLPVSKQLKALSKRFKQCDIKLKQAELAKQRMEEAGEKVQKITQKFTQAQSARAQLIEEYNALMQLSAPEKQISPSQLKLKRSSPS